MNCCTEIVPYEGCYQDEKGLCQSVLIHYEYGCNDKGEKIIASVRITDILGVVIKEANEKNTTVGACKYSEIEVCASDGETDGIRVLATRCNGKWGSAENVQHGHPDIGKIYAIGEWKFASDECNCINDCCDKFCGNKWVDCNGECINWSCK